MNEKNELEWDVDRDMLQRHAVTVMEGLGAAVESLDDSDFLNSVLISIGQTHIKRNVKPQMLRVRPSTAPKYHKITHIATPHVTIKTTCYFNGNGNI
nr:neuroglobin [Biomphalaria glabrata]